MNIYKGYRFDSLRAIREEVDSISEENFEKIIPDFYIEETFIDKFRELGCEQVWQIPLYSDCDACCNKNLTDNMFAYVIGQTYFILIPLHLSFAEDVMPKISLFKEDNDSYCVFFEKKTQPHIVLTMDELFGLRENINNLLNG